MGDLPNSSPVTPSAGLCFSNILRSSRSISWSASVTGVKSGLVSIFRSVARNLAVEILSAISANSCANFRSSAYFKVLPATSKDMHQG